MVKIFNLPQRVAKISFQNRYFMSVLWFFEHTIDCQLDILNNSEQVCRIMETTMVKIKPVVLITRNILSNE